MFEIINKINSSKDVQKLNSTELDLLADETRSLIINKLTKQAGHCGSNLGIIEATIALHYVFDFEKDKIVFDVSHQCYPHKILTGRKNAWLNENEFNSISGYSNPDESDYDVFKVGHTSTSISLATGLAKARDLNHENHNIVAVIGDGSLSGGQSFEGLNNASLLNSQLLIVVNDNDMSISDNVGGLYQNLKQLRTTKGKYENNYFKTFGFEYLFVENGNNIQDLISAFSKAKQIKKPIVVHICTQKGKGLEWAENNKEAWHWSVPFDKETGISKKSNFEGIMNYTALTREFLRDKAKTKKDFVVITPAVPVGCGFTPEFRAELGERYVDVGIAEPHAISFASGLAKAGIKPIVGLNSSFVQRTYDQLLQDVGLNNLPVLVLLYKSGIAPMDPTHIGLFDTSMTSSIPNVVCMSPSKEDYLSALNWAIEQNDYPIIMRVPFESSEEPLSLNFQLQNFEPFKSKILKSGEKIAIFAVQKTLHIAQKLSNAIKSALGVESTIVDAIYTNGLDTSLAKNLAKNHSIFVSLEDGLLEGGFGEKLASILSYTNCKVLSYGAKKEFFDKTPLSQLYDNFGMNAEMILTTIKELIQK